MTKADAEALRVKWKQQADPPRLSASEPGIGSQRRRLSDGQLSLHRLR